MKCCDECDYVDQQEQENATMMTNDDLICADIDVVVEQVAGQAGQRDFPAVLNEWTDAMLKLNRAAIGTEAILMVTRLGILGQALIYEANMLGLNQALKLWRERETKR